VSCEALLEYLLHALCNLSMHGPWPDRVYREVGHGRISGSVTCTNGLSQQLSAYIVGEALARLQRRKERHLQNALNSCAQTVDIRTSPPSYRSCPILTNGQQAQGADHSNA
jgi:hypothetical protein